MRPFVLGTLILCACGSPGGGGGADAAGGDDAGSADAPPGTPDAPAAIVDHDGDGLDDALETTLAITYRPFLSVHPDDGCPLGGIAVRVWPHPDDATKIAIIYDHLFERDCGLTGHLGDDEVFGVTIDPDVPPPAGVLGVRTASHQGTICERITECGRCSGQTACDTGQVSGMAMPVVYSSKGKHGSYLQRPACAASCFDQCAMAPSSNDPPLVNVGEPGASLVEDLTQGGLITMANGWTETELFDFDPWAPGDFGSAGDVSQDLVDPTFIVPVCN